MSYLFIYTVTYTHTQATDTHSAQGLYSYHTWTLRAQASGGTAVKCATCQLVRYNKMCQAGEEGAMLIPH